jgi:hypothetical protein
MRLAVNKSDMPGNFTNLTTGEKVNGSSGKTFMGKLSWTPIRNLDIDLLPHYNEQDQQPRRDGGERLLPHHRLGRRRQPGADAGRPGHRLHERQSAAAGLRHAGRHQPLRSEQPQRAPRLPDRDQLATSAPA